MAEAPNTSFIPKQSPVRRTKQPGSRQVHFLTLISYGLFTVTLLGTAGIFFYERHTEKQLSVKVEELNSAIDGFKEEDMNQVRKFDARLAQARERLENSISIAAIFAALEDATVQSVAIENLTLTRHEDSGVSVEADMKTDNFDSSLFQRGVLERSPVVEAVLIEDLSIEAESEVGPEGVTFVANLTIPPDRVPNIPSTEIDSSSAPTYSTSSTETVSDTVNQENP